MIWFYAFGALCAVWLALGLFEIYKAFRDNPERS